MPAQSWLNMNADVLIVEDEPSIAELLAINLRHAGLKVRLAADAAQARSAVSDRLPDLVLLDWMLPGESGLQLARHWRASERTRALPIIMLTARAQEDDRVAGLDAGADDYLVKPFSTKELLARVRAVLRRRAPDRTDDALTLGGIELQPGQRRVAAGAQLVELSPKEYRLLHFLMAHPDRVHSRSELLNRVWGDHVFIDDRTVDVHIKRLRQALRQVGADAPLETVRGMGYRFNSQT
jgi:two-component system phosphate regulon response regulator PhoB